MKERYQSTAGLVGPGVRRRARLRAARAHGCATRTLCVPTCVFALVLALSRCTCAAYAQSNDVSLFTCLCGHYEVTDLTVGARRSTARLA